MMLWIYLNLAFYPFISLHLAKNVIVFEATETYKTHICLYVYMSWSPPLSGKWQSLAAGRPVCSFPSNAASSIYLTATWSFQKNNENKNKYQRLEHDMKAVRLPEVLGIDLNHLCGTAAKSAYGVMNFLLNIIAMWAYNMALPSVHILQLYF